MRKLTGIETAAVRLANEVKDLQDSVQDTRAISVVDIRDRVNYIGGYASALKAIIENEKGAEA